MKIATKLLLSSALLIAPALLMAPLAMAQEETEAADQPRLAGEIVWSWRAFADRPDATDRAKFEQYGEVPPGFFIDEAHIFTDASSGPLFEAWASNVGYNNQLYEMRYYNPGDYYFTLGYSEIPHLYSTQARTLYDAVAPSVLRAPDSIQAALESAPNDAARAAIIDANLHMRDIEVTRQTGRVGFRWTPSPAWDIRVDYSNEDRSGAMPFGTAINGFNTLELPAPVSYSTQNFSVSAQYAGRINEEQRWSMSLAYVGSLFHNDLTSFTFDNPFRLSAPVGNNTANEGRNSLPPSNDAHRLTLTGAVDLSPTARYVGSVSYGIMRQDEQFLPFTINPTILGSGGTPMTDLSLLPAQSLDGEIEELLLNNQLTMRFGQHWTGTARLRYLDVRNNTPLLFFPEYVRADGQRQNDDRQNYRPAYARTNSSFELNWRPDTQWSLGGSVAWERYDRDNRDADVTEETSGRIFLDASPDSLPWLRLRASALHAQRRYRDYDALNNVGVIGYPPAGAGFLQNPLLRKFDMADRDRTRIDSSGELAFDNGLVITPSMSWRTDEYSDNISNGGDLGLKDESYWNGGIEVAYPLTDSINMSLSYLREQYNRLLVNRQRGGTGSTGIACPTAGVGSDTCGWGSEISDYVDTIFGNASFILSSNIELELSGTYSRTSNTTDTYSLGTALVNSVPRYPDVRNDYQGLDASLKYNLSEALGQRLGWTGDLSTELGYAYERNSMTNWATESMAPYMIALDAGANRSLFLDALNPNYEAHIVTVSLRMGW
ncbi:MAG TPA: hypothetical protein DHW63_11370 [Hyphomonadaceae bacterium]|nr:hypothetical protein [Hyphomonadaceae bacterium]